MFPHLTCAAKLQLKKQQNESVDGDKKRRFPVNISIALMLTGFSEQVLKTYLRKLEDISKKLNSSEGKETSA